MKKNCQFDRIELSKSNIYNNIRGKEGIGGIKFEGYFKCKLVHCDMFSVIVPDLIYIMEDDSNFSWFQHYSFLPNHLTKFSEEEIYGTINIDIAWGHTLTITISNEWHISNFQDNSNLFKCRITGPKNLLDYATGKGKMIDGKPFINLYHHTSNEIKKLIEESGHFIGSVWNYQGTKKLESLCFSYFTSLDKIIQEQDLVQIAMANEGEIFLMKDITQEILTLKVYRENTLNRKATLVQLIDSTILMSNPILKHTQDDLSYVFYERSNPFIYRVGLEPNMTLPFYKGIINRTENVHISDHIILGDATTELGLVAIFDEENTEHVFKIEPFYKSKTNILKFWFDNNNSDLYTKKKINKPKFNNS
ncbi:MAG: hypothetical protein JXQ93_03675 [Flavobacteriaceae bacterium]